jgi:hypothetical protein
MEWSPSGCRGDGTQRLCRGGVAAFPKSGGQHV